MIFTLQEVSLSAVSVENLKNGNKKRTAVKQQSVFVCQSVQTDARIVFDTKLSYEHPSCSPGVLSYLFFGMNGFTNSFRNSSIIYALLLNSLIVSIALNRRKVASSQYILTSLSSSSTFSCIQSLRTMISPILSIILKTTLTYLNELIIIYIEFFS